jgi:predicted nuclease with TOPRIM domain
LQEQLKKRLDELKKEYETGQARLRELEAETNHVGETMLRISGAIQVIQEMLNDSNDQEKSESAASGGEPSA